MSEQLDSPPSEPGFFRNSGGRLLLLFAGIGIAAFAVGFLFTAIFLFGGGVGDEVLTVPDLRGQSEEQARRITVRMGLEFEVGPSLANPEFAEGQVLAQSPLPGEEVAPGSPVRVVLSAGAETRAVPEVRTLSGSQARDLLARSGFEPVVEEQTNPAPAGRILEVTPPPGTRLALPATVHLVVSAGPPQAAVPDLVGMSEAQARQVIEGAGFSVGELNYDFFSPYPAGTVVGQSRSAGSDASIGSGIGLTIAGSAPGNL